MRLNYTNLSPDGYQTLLAMYGYLKKTSLSPALLHVIYLRVSQMNGCPYCVDLHWNDAVNAGESVRKLNAVVCWKEMPFFSEKEKAALAFAEAMTLLPDKSVPEDIFTQALNLFGDKELVDLSFAIAHMNMLNRVAITFHKIPEV